MRLQGYISGLNVGQAWTICGILVG